MPEDPLAYAPTSLKEEVRYHIAWMAGFRKHPTQLKPDDQLDADLRLTAYQRRALYTPLLRTAREYNANPGKDPSLVVTPTACQKLKTVKDAIDLVEKAATR